MSASTKWNEIIPHLLFFTCFMFVPNTIVHVWMSVLQSPTRIYHNISHVGSMVTASIHQHILQSHAWLKFAWNCIGEIGRFEIYTIFLHGLYVQSTEFILCFFPLLNRKKWFQRRLAKWKLQTIKVQQPQWRKLKRASWK